MMIVMLCHASYDDRNAVSLNHRAAGTHSLQVVAGPILPFFKCKPKTAYPHTNCPTQEISKSEGAYVIIAAYAIFPAVATRASYLKFGSTFALPTSWPAGSLTKSFYYQNHNTSKQKQNYPTLKYYKYAEKAKSDKRQTPVQKWPFQGVFRKMEVGLSTGASQRRKYENVEMDRNDPNYDSSEE